MTDLEEKAAFYRAQAERERIELKNVTLPMVRARHTAAVARWERLASRAEAGWNNQTMRADGNLSVRSEPVRAGGWTRDQEYELVARVGAGEPLVKVAQELGRTPSAAKLRLHIIRRRT